MKLSASIKLFLGLLFVWGPHPCSLGKTVEDLKNQYRPSNPRNLGSSGSPLYRQLAAQVWWESVINSTVESHLNKFLQKRVSSGNSPRQVVIADPGVSAMTGPALAEGVLENLLRNPEFLTQVGSRLVRLKQWTSGQLVSSTIPKSQLEALSSDSKLKELLVIWSNEEDFLPASLEILSSLRSSVEKEDWERYRKLAVAISLVDDQLYPANTPHSQVDISQLPTPATPEEKFQDIIRAERKGRLHRAMSTLSVGELFFVVAHKMSIKDLNWARDNRPHPDPERLASTSFASVEYQESRASAGQYSWSGLPYTPENIIRHGGICVDQAYYADLMCKASGIPSMMFTGTGDEGGHAWVGFLSKNGSWDVTVGREGGVYLTGKTYNPQNWMSETDHDFGPLTAENAAQARFESNLAAMFWDAGFLAHATEAINAASNLAPSAPSIWSKKFEYSSKTKKTEEISSGLKTALRNKNLSPSVRATVKKELASAERDLGRHASALRVEKNIVDENIASRSDISSQTISDRVRVLLEKGDITKALSEYKTAIRNLPEGSRGDFFYNVTRPLCGYLTDIGKRPQAMHVARLARQRLNPPKDSLLDLDLREMEKRASLIKK